MNSAEDMLGYYTGKGLAWKWPEPLRRRGTDGGGQITDTSYEVSQLTMRPTGGCVKEIG